MKKSNVQFTKRTAAFALAVGLALTLCACGENAADPDGSTAPAADVELPGNDTAAEDSAPDTEAGAAQAAEAETPSADEDKTADESAVIISEDPASPVTITMEPPEKQELTAEDGTVYYTSEYSYPVVSIEGNTAAADKINADILAQMDTVRASGETAAQESLDWLNSLSESDESLPGDFPASSDNVSYSVQRADDRVISFTVNYYSYAGGAHGYTFWRGAVYDAQTGEKLALEDLSDDPEAFRAATLAYNQELAATESYSERMFSTDAITDGTLETVLYEEEDVWYLSPSGLVFVSDAYDLGPYAAGAIEFIIPYRDLPDMGFKEAYAYDGRLIMPLGEKQEYTADLNGDGAEETISLYNESLYDDASGVSTTVNHLLIDGTDYADAVSDALSETTWAYLVMYDLDREDDYVEFALCGNYTEGDEYPPYSQFFRYGKDKSLLYLGKANGYANDTATVIRELTP